MPDCCELKRRSDLSRPGPALRRRSMDKAASTVSDLVEICMYGMRHTVRE